MLRPATHSCRPAPTVKRHRLLREHGLGDHVAGYGGIEGMLGDQIAAFRNDEVRVLQDFQLLEAIVLREAHALPDDLQQVDDLERPVALVRAQRAMVGVVDRDQRIDISVPRRFQLPQLQLAAVAPAAPRG